ncbi:glycoside hydrolase family 13 protein [Pseudomarimonas arenosa]|uniref:Glycoside hydrolase family 13 protein n=1 Tax=Pseudomarimonas arenosa TaxID=2774145 RepID=A0AAW3ZP49_9GAMM|nr:glycoside hydrolase family 13 protein [Pseudomarimonas arenosa]MBD8526402.1 glycoside hydrolase family 13 protein [Pseudomarimonas arenosa]
MRVSVRLMSFGLMSFGLLLLALPGFALANQSLRVEPPFWWVGMRDPSLQLMIHAPDIAKAEARSVSKDVTITAQHRLSSPNYLFVDLVIAADTAPGTVSLELTRDGQSVAQIEYPLQARRKGSADRVGFGPQDAIYLLVPDRFANGDPRNDNSADTLEKIDRSKPGGRHGGDLAGMSQALPYLADLGITQIWPTPLVENDMPAYSYHGYAPTDLYRIDPRFGSNEDYRAFVAAAGQRGIGVIQDIVLNHIGSHHHWLRDPPSADWINGNGQFSPTTHARTTVQDRYAAAVDRDEFLQGWFVETMPDLNQRNPFLATYLIQNSLWWIEYADLSGIREDTYPYSEPDFLARWSKRIVQEYPSFSIVGEEWSRNPTIVSHWQANAGQSRHADSATNAMMDFPLYYELSEALAQDDGQKALDRLYQALVNDALYPAPERMVLFDGNHDTPRLYSLLGEDQGRYRAALTYLLTLPRTPQLFYGSEVAMSSPVERDDGRVRGDFPGGWAGDKVNGFTGAGLTDTARRTQQLVRSLLRFRRSSSALTRGDLIHFLPKDGVYVFARRSAEQTVLVAINRSAMEQTLDARRFREALGDAGELLDVLDQTRVDLGQGIRVPADDIRVLESTSAPQR